MRCAVCFSTLPLNGAESKTTSNLAPKKQHEHLGCRLRGKVVHEGDALDPLALEKSRVCCVCLLFTVLLSGVNDLFFLSFFL